MALARSDNVLINGIRVSHTTGQALGELAVKTRNALNGVAGELSKHDLQVSELQQIIAVLKTLHGLDELRSVQYLLQPTAIETSTSANSAVVAVSSATAEVKA